jgi:molybdopterin synthase sulfur carrier subunit
MQHPDMAQVTFTAHLARIAPPAPVDAAGSTVAEALRDVFARYPALRGYILDDQDRLRLHIAIFVDGVHVRADALNYPLHAASDLHVLQALSGGNTA